MNSDLTFENVYLPISSMPPALIRSNSFRVCGVWCMVYLCGTGAGRVSKRRLRAATHCNTLLCKVHTWWYKHTRDMHIHIDTHRHRLTWAQKDTPTHTGNQIYVRFYTHMCMYICHDMHTRRGCRFIVLDLEASKQRSTSTKIPRHTFLDIDSPRHEAPRHTFIDIDSST